ncbi:unnamed protein product [Fraxinus pennsylvanica]|uniref:HEAT repeat domain-containing protein n=1 Tax=Fraxinus pennsylvanica TaxID=56036 RepID=A0AAD1ZIV7_9LAMI|nr:unnamed protein product [Fraxinus pennsylvanica]
MAAYKSKTVEKASKEFLCDLLLEENQPISERFRAFAMRDKSSILGHGAANKLGRMQDPDAIPALQAVLGDLSLHPIVRLKAAESLGAFGLESSVPVLKTAFESDPSAEVKESCELALTRIRELTNAKPDELRRFNLLEVAPLLFRPIPELREVLLNEDNSLYERCSALFSLRLYCLHPTSCTEEAISAIIESLYAESTVLRCHVLQSASEHPLVRHNAADALHSIAVKEGLDSTTYRECIMLLKEFAEDPDPIVSQSCELAIRMLDFKRSARNFLVDRSLRHGEHRAFDREKSNLAKQLRICLIFIRPIKQLQATTAKILV